MLVFGVRSKATGLSFCYKMPSDLNKLNFIMPAEKDALCSSNGHYCSDIKSASVVMKTKGE